MKKLLVSGVLAVIAAFVWNTQSASAHHPEVSAVPSCPEGIPVIDVTAEAWNSLDFGYDESHRINPDVLVEIDGPGGLHLEQAGAFAAPDYAFTVQFALPADTIGQTLDVTVTARAEWGPNGEYASIPPTAETQVTIPPTCDGGAAPSTTSAPSTTAAPSTSVAPTSTVAPDTTAPAPSTPGGDTGGVEIETEVAGITEVRPQVPNTGAGATQVGGQGGQLAFTGSDSGPLVLGSAGLLAIGAGLMLGARKRRQAA